MHENISESFVTRNQSQSRNLKDKENSSFERLSSNTNQFRNEFDLYNARELYLKIRKELITQTTEFL